MPEVQNDTIEVKQVIIMGQIVITNAYSNDVTDARSRMVVSLTAAVPDVLIAGEGQRGRVALHDFITSEFLQHYGAHVKTFMPWLLGLSTDNALVGVAGLRPAAEEPLFIEQYLDRRIEAEIAHHVGFPVHRQRIVEIGNLAGHYPGVTRSLFPLLTELVYTRGYEWTVCNTTPTVQNALKKLGIAFIPMVHAMPERLGAARFTWGRYYRQETTVIAIPILAAHDALQQQPALAAACSMALTGKITCFPSARHQ